jgi:2,3-bisphosphoglycerate-independent phosphoglycerate mutase
MGLTSDGGVHSHINYITKLIKLFKEQNITRIVYHAITDGRDTFPKSSGKYLEEIDNLLQQEDIGYIGTICGRYYAMDRDNKWERTKVYYDLVMNNRGYKINNYQNAILNCYNKNITDEFLPPMIVHDDIQIKENDVLLWLNFRTDRARQILNAFTDEDFKEFNVRKVNNFHVYNMFAQDDVKNVKSLFEMPKGELYPIGKYFSDLKLTQARIAETEKYSHVTYFFNSELSKKFDGCDNYLVPSPKVATYDMAPAMSAREVSKKVKEALEKDYDFILVNYANPDMLGHTGNMKATIEGLKYLDYLLKEVITCAEDNFYKTFILADHGNCDEMLSSEGEVITTHSLAKVPFIILDRNVKLKESGDLTMVAPTLLKYMDIAIPKDMENTKNLIIEE